MKAFRLALARKLFEAGLWKLGGFVLREGDVLFLKGGETMVFRHNGRLEPRKGRGQNGRREAAAGGAALAKAAKT